MNILFYIPDISQSQGGIRQYAIGLLNILAKDSCNHYYIYHNVNDSLIIDLINKNRHFILVQNKDYNPSLLNLIKNRAKRFLNKPLKLVNLSYKIHQEAIVDKLCIQFGINIIHCPYQFAPNTNKAKIITTLHDVQELHYPEFFSPEERAYRANNYMTFLSRANKIVVSYSHIKDDLLKFFQIAPHKIDVILLDMGKLWFEKYTPIDIVPLNNFDIPDKYIFYPAATWKHKNHIGLLKSVAYLRDEHNISVNVVCSGHLNEHYHDEISIVQKKLNLCEQVKFLGIVDETELYSLYRRALGVVVPTLYEAGSFPLMESILMKIPVICSNVTSLPETIKDEQFIFDPLNIKDISFKMKEIWESENFRESSINNSLKVESAILDSNSLKKFKNIYHQLINLS